MTFAEKILANLTALFPTWDNESQLSIKTTISNGVGICLDETQLELDDTVSIITDIIKTQRPGDSQYYIDKAIAWEPGVDLVQDENLKWIYQEPDETKQLIVQAAVSITEGEGSETITLKVNKTDPDTELLAKLSTDELSDFKNNYMRLFQWLGVPITITTADPDLLSFTIEISFLNNYDETTVQSNVDDALVAFRDTYKHNGVIWMNVLGKYIIDNVPGVKAAYVYDFDIPDVEFDNDFAVLPSGSFNYDTVTKNYVSVNANV
jgi:hypothetical protein